MERKKAERILRAFYSPPQKIGEKLGKVIGQEGTFSFLSQSIEDVEEIEKLTNADLVEEWKHYYLNNCIYNIISVNELQRMQLLITEMEERKILTPKFEKNLGKWIKKSEKEAEKVKNELREYNPDRKKDVKL